MRYTTDFLGQVDIDPPLNHAEQAYLSAFAESRRWERGEGPYAVSGNPAAEEDVRPQDEGAYNRPAAGQPELWCQWVPCWDGCCLSFDGHEKCYAPVAWMRYLFGHFLEPGAEASRSGDPRFAESSFDHVLDGLIVGCRRDTRELFGIRVTDNAVTRQCLRSGDVPAEARAALAYEAVLDADWAARRRPRLRRPGNGSGESALRVIRPS